MIKIQENTDPLIPLVTDASAEALFPVLFATLYSLNFTKPKPGLFSPSVEGCRQCWGDTVKQPWEAGQGSFEEQG